MGHGVHDGASGPKEFGQNELKEGLDIEIVVLFVKQDTEFLDNGHQFRFLITDSSRY